VTIVLATFSNPCLLCGAKADHTIEVCDVRSTRNPVAPVGRAPRPCLRCAGTGMHISGMLNGRPQPSGLGPCFRCAGKGHQTDADVARNNAYDEYAGAKAFRADMGKATIVAVHPDGPECEHCGRTTDHTVVECELAGSGVSLAEIGETDPDTGEFYIN
jgi:hypothetical protein